ncbi:MAG TPA: serine protease, partial [Armatimonadota bacterium]
MDMRNARLLAMLFLVCSVVAGRSATVAEVAQQCAVSVVQVVMLDGQDHRLSTGSGFVVAPGLVVTCYHVVANGVAAQVKTTDKISYPVAGVVAVSREHDLALLRVTRLTDLPALALSEGEATEGEAVVALGSPLGLEGSSTTDGVV